MQQVDKKAGANVQLIQYDNEGMLLLFLVLIEEH
ncbi:hypothetical protein K151_655 [Proteus hauseri ZMd44]|nr:hypothetical protein K151_655 [Proteus hauseri ZMd44]